LEYFPKACDADEETRKGCVSILDEHFVDVKGLHSKMFEYRNAELVVLKVQGYGNKEGNDEEFLIKPVSFVLFSVLNCTKEENLDGDDESSSDETMSNTKDGMYVFYRATTDLSLKEMFPQCKLFAEFSGTTSGLGIGTFLLCFVQ
jgi:hypothetical protein